MEDEPLAKRLKRLRLRKGLSVKELSFKTNIPISTYREWENGREILGEPYQKLSLVLDVSIFELITGSRPEAFEVEEQILLIESQLILLKKTLRSFY